MKISVVIPTFNRFNSLFHAVESVLGQTIPPDEVIIVDDGSADDTATLAADRFGSRVSLLRQNNAGVSAARNRGINAATGDWIAFLDSDDVWLPQKLARQVDALKVFGDCAGVCFTDNSYGGNANMSFTRFQEVGLDDTPPIGILEDPVGLIATHREPFFTSSLLICRNLLCEIGGFDELLRLREDSDLVFRLALRTRFCFVREPLVRIDRTPARTDGLCDLYAARNDAVFESLELLYRKWLAMLTVGDSLLRTPLEQLLQGTLYNSLETKLKELRVRAASRDALKLKALGVSYFAIAWSLIGRKASKLRRDMFNAPGETH